MKKEALALLMNDIHVSKDNIAEFQKNWDEALEICESRGIGDIIIGGDMFTERASQSLATLIAVQHALEKAVRMGLFVVIAEGNHDKVNLDEIEGYNHLWKGLASIDVVDGYKVCEWEDCDFVMVVMSYFPENGSFSHWLSNALGDAMRSVASKKDIILYIHEGVHGALGNMEIEGELSQEELSGFKAVLCGHYHNRVKIKGTNIEYIGASRQHNFGEDEEKGYTVLYDDGSWEFVKNRVNTRYKTIEAGFEDEPTTELPGTDGVPYRYKVKVRCTDKEAKLFDKQKWLDAGFNKVEVVAETQISKEVAASGISEKYDAAGIRKEYQGYCDENGIDSELGMRYLAND